MRLKNPEVTCQELIWVDDKEHEQNEMWEEIQMTENKNLEELRNELEQSKQEKIQLEHQIQRKRNQLSYRENFSRKERSHRLIVCGAIFEKYFPVVKDLSEKELSEVLSSVNVTAFGSELDRAIEQMRKEVTE